MDSLSLGGFVSLSERGPRFLIPVFQLDMGSNARYIQRVDRAGRIAEFLPVSVAQSQLIETDSHTERRIGDQAIFGISDGRGGIIAGTELEITERHSKQLQRMLSSKTISSQVTFSANLCIFFVNAVPERMRDRAIRTAYTSLSERSKISGRIWRDAVAIPAIIRRLDTEQRPDSAFYVESAPPHCTIFSTHEISEDKIRKIANFLRPFDIEKVHVRIWTHPVPDLDRIRWLLIGQGGVARHVFQNDPFEGRPLRIGRIPGRFSVAAISKLPFEADDRRSTVAITKSDEASVSNLIKAYDELSSDPSRTYTLNVRPIGFGAVSDRMLSPFEIRSRLGHLGSTWAITRHRQRQSPSGHHGLRASNMASRICKLATHCLIEGELASSALARDSMKQIRKPGSLGIVSSVKIIDPADIEGNLARLFRACASTEMDVERGESFFVFWPGAEASLENIQFRVLDGTYSAYILPVVQNISHSIVGFRTAVRGGNDASFRRMCAMMMEDYRWRFRGDDGFRMFFENEGEGMSVIPIYDRSQLEASYNRQRRDDQGDILMTNFSLRDAEYDWFSNEGRLLHFSELGTWMRVNYRTEQYRDW